MSFRQKFICIVLFLTGIMLVVGVLVSTASALEKSQKTQPETSNKEIPDATAELLDFTSNKFYFRALPNDHMYDLFRARTLIINSIDVTFYEVTDKTKDRLAGGSIDLSKGTEGLIKHTESVDFTDLDDNFVGYTDNRDFDFNTSFILEKWNERCGRPFEVKIHADLVFWKTEKLENGKTKPPYVDKTVPVTDVKTFPAGNTFVFRCDENGRPE